MRYLFLSVALIALSVSIYQAMRIGSLTDEVSALSLRQKGLSNHVKALSVAQAPQKESPEHGGLAEVAIAAPPPVDTTSLQDRVSRAEAAIKSMEGQLAARQESGVSAADREALTLYQYDFCSWLSVALGKGADELNGAPAVDAKYWQAALSGSQGDQAAGVAWKNKTGDPTAVTAMRRLQSTFTGEMAKYIPDVMTFAEREGAAYHKTLAEVVYAVPVQRVGRALRMEGDPWDRMFKEDGAKK